MARILVATDAWRPQVNGVVRTYERVAERLENRGHAVAFLSPSDFRTLPFPTYPQIRMAIPDHAHATAIIDRFGPDAIHIATEGPVGVMAQRYCRQRGRRFTTSFHTRFPEYLASRFFIPRSLSYAYMRRFHNRGAGIMVATPSMSKELSERGFRNLLPWTRGVDTELFRPRTVREFGPAPVFLFVGRVAIEKNIEAFLDLDLPGRKVVVGDGPLLPTLRRRFPHVFFAGERTGEALATAYASSDVFVFPSRTETFGIVLLEALASGLPVAAFPCTGPIDVVSDGTTGFLSEDLKQSALSALTLDREAVRRAAAAYSWEATARIFLDNITKAVLSPLDTKAEFDGSAAVSLAARSGS